MRGRRWIVAAPILFVLLWATAIYWGSHSEGFTFLQNKIRTSAYIRNRIGYVRRVSLPVFGLYREKITSSSRSAKFVVDVQGDRSSVRVRATIRKNADTWSVVESSIDDQRISLE